MRDRRALQRDATPDFGGLRDGEVIAWSSPLGRYVEQKQKIADTASTDRWLRTQ